MGREGGCIGRVPTGDAQSEMIDEEQQFELDYPNSRLRAKRAWVAAQGQKRRGIRIEIGTKSTEFKRSSTCNDTRGLTERDNDRFTSPYSLHPMIARCDYRGGHAKIHPGERERV